MQYQFTSVSYKFKRQYISEIEYNKFKNEIKNNQNIEINSKSLIQNFNQEFKILKYCIGFFIVISVIGVFIDNKSEDGIIERVFMLAFGALILTFFCTIFALLLGGIMSYSTYIKNEIKFYEEMKNIIIRTRNYTEFSSKFNIK